MARVTITRASSCSGWLLGKLNIKGDAHTLWKQPVYYAILWKAGPRIVPADKLCLTPVR